MRILSIDPGTTTGNLTGWAIFDDEELKAYGNFKYKNTGLKRVKKIAEDFSRLLKMYENIDHLALEKPYGPNRQSLETMNIFFGVVLTKAVEIGIDEYEFYHPTHVKKVVTGNGRCSKDEMNKYICEFYGLTEDIQKDTADAVGIGLTAIRDMEEKS
ncbi:MAG: crossover junction endodeoxyribonuclease RuvC [Bacillota bacterium]